VHANWIIGKLNKHLALKQYGYWLAKPAVVRDATHGSKTVYTCLPYKPT